MLITLKNAVELLEKDDVVEVTYVYSNVTPKFWNLTKDITVLLSCKTVITIPAGFKTDFSTVPKFLWGIFPPYGDFLLACIIHDYLYVNQPKGITRAMADKEMLIWSKLLNGDLAYDSKIRYYWKRMDNIVRYYAVRLFGWSYWNKVFHFSSKNKNV